MAGFVIIAEFSAPAEHRDAFLDACRGDAAGSVRDEPGCHQFDVLTPEGRPDLVVLYEVYDDRAAFDAHKRTPHYAAFADAVTRLGVDTVQVRMLDRRDA